VTLYRGTVLFEEAVWEMAKSPKNLRERLVDAFHHLVGCKLPGSLPDDILADFEKLWTQVTSVDP